MRKILIPLACRRGVLISGAGVLLRRKNSIIKRAQHEIRTNHALFPFLCIFGCNSQIIDSIKSLARYIHTTE